MPSENPTHLTQDELTGFRRRSLAPEETSLADRHLSECPDCSRRYRRTGPPPSLPAVAAETGDTLHLTDEQISDYLDAAPESPIWTMVESHIAFCRSCAAEVRDLVAFEAKFVPAPQAVSARQPAAVPAAAAESWWQAALAFLKEPWRPAFGGAALAMAASGILLVALNPASPAGMASGPAAADSYFSRYQFDFQFIAGAALAIVGIAGLAYRTVRKNKNENKSNFK